MADKSKVYETITARDRERACKFLFSIGQAWRQRSTEERDYDIVSLAQEFADSRAEAELVIRENADAEWRALCKTSF